MQFTWKEHITKCDTYIRTIDHENEETVKFDVQNWCIMLLLTTLQMCG